MMIWVQIDAQDDLWQVADAEVDGDCADVKLMADDVENQFELYVTRRLIDPNMGRTGAIASRRREVTWQDEFDSVGLRCDLADDSRVGIARVNEWLKPDENTMKPRMHIHERCNNTIFQFGRYVWDEFRRSTEKDMRQTPRTKNDDYPTLWKYLANSDPSFAMLRDGPRRVRRDIVSPTPSRKMA